MVNNKGYIRNQYHPFIVHHPSFLYTVFWLLFLYQQCDNCRTDKGTITRRQYIKTMNGEQ